MSDFKSIECTKFDFFWDCSESPKESHAEWLIWELTALLRSYSCICEAYFLGRWGEGRGEERGGWRRDGRVEKEGKMGLSGQFLRAQWFTAWMHALIQRMLCHCVWFGRRGRRQSPQRQDNESRGAPQSRCNLSQTPHFRGEMLIAPSWKLTVSHK